MSPKSTPPWPVEQERFGLGDPFAQREYEGRVGNRRVMKTQSRLERDRVIDAYELDLDGDIKQEGPMHEVPRRRSD